MMPRAVSEGRSLLSQLQRVTALWWVEPSWLGGVLELFRSPHSHSLPWSLLLDLPCIRHR